MRTMNFIETSDIVLYLQSVKSNECKEEFFFKLSVTCEILVLFILLKAYSFLNDLIVLLYLLAFAKSLCILSFALCYHEEENSRIGLQWIICIEVCFTEVKSFDNLPPQIFLCQCWFRVTSMRIFLNREIIMRIPEKITETMILSRWILVSGVFRC